MKYRQVKVSALSFSKSRFLRDELLRWYPQALFNESGRILEGAELAYFLESADAAIVGTEKIDAALLKSCPDLRVVVKYGVGMDNLDLPALKAANVQVLQEPGTNRQGVAELVVCMMIALSRNVFATAQDLKSGIWNKNGGVEIRGKTVGIIGVGHVGKKLVDYLEPFGCRILVNDVIDQKSYYEEHDLREVEKEYLFRQSDIITIHTPLTDLTRNLVNEKTLSWMQPTAFLINTARGEIVDLAALKAALKNKTIAGAALDVYHPEPPQDAELLRLPNFLCTPHIGGNSVEAVRAMGTAAIDLLRRFEEE